MRYRIGWIFLGTALALPLAQASDQVGTLTQHVGEVRIYTHPSNTLDSERDLASGKRALFEGKYYRVTVAKTGDQVEEGNVVWTAPGAKARIVFDNGDQYNIAPGTAYRVNWDQDSRSGKPEVKLMYGKLRGIVQKGGPRTGLKVRVRSVVMGVRGTDFFVALDPTSGNSEVGVLRGQVEVSTETRGRKPIQVKTGELAAQESGWAGLEKRKVTRPDLAQIATDFKMQRKPASTEPPEIQALEKRAVQVALEDVRAHDPLAYKEMVARGAQDPDEVNAIVVERLRKTAPPGPEKRKPSRTELEELERGQPEKYMKKAR